jgi:protein-tyrosine kinase
MSIVERALKKIQTNERPVAPVFGRVIDGPRPAEGHPPAHAPAPARMVTINQEVLRSAGLLPPEHRERQIANQYRQIKRPLVSNAVGRGKPPLPNGQLIMVASALPGEGKTFTSVNLAFSIAREQDLRILLVDADVIKPQVSRMFGIGEERGLLDVLVDPTVELESLVLSTDVPNLSVLPAGTANDQATELLAGARMAAVMREATRRDPSRIILFDSPPILPTTEARALAQLAGQIVIVVRENYTQQSDVLDALGYLPEGAHAALILNQSVARRESESYYYGYGSPNGRSDPS